MTADKYLRFSMVCILKVPQRRAILEIEWVERVNPTSEKPKIGRGTNKSKFKDALDTTV